ncbi:hypothetical protein VCHC68A1_01741A, partial [Vibrio cholerae HC-68A1]
MSGYTESEHRAIASRRSGWELARKGVVT